MSHPMLPLLKTLTFMPAGRLFTDSGDMQWGGVGLFNGAPGSSKSSMFRQFVQSMRYRNPENPDELLPMPYECLKYGARGDGGVGVVPVPREGPNGEMVLDFPMPAMMAEKFRHGVGFMLFDELNTSPPALQPALLCALQEGEFGAHRLGPRVRRFGATNSLEDAANGWKLAPPLANRMFHIPYPDPEISAFTGYLLSGAEPEKLPQIIVDDLEKFTLERWSNVWPRTGGMVAAFLQRRETLLRQQPRAADPKSAGPWASPRTWEYLARFYAAAVIHGLDPELTQLGMENVVGQGPAEEFIQFRSAADLPDPLDILDGKVTFTYDKARLDRNYAVMSSCTAVVVGESCDNRDDRVRAYWDLAKVVSEGGGADILMAQMEVLTSAVVRLGTDLMPTYCQDFIGELYPMA